MKDLFELNQGDWSLRRIEDYQGPLGEVFDTSECRYKFYGTYDAVKKVIFDAGNHCIVRINGVPAFAI